MTELSRRRLLAGVAAAGVSGLLDGCTERRALPLGPAFAPTLSVVGNGSLKAHAAAKGILYGCAVDVGALHTGAAYAALVRGQAGIVAGERAMTWSALRPSRQLYDFSEADALVAFAEANRIRARGRTLCPSRELPGWFDREATPENARGMLEEHIDRVAGRYAGRMHSWDVVSEAVEVNDGRPDGLRRTPWLDLIGPDYVELAFRRARAADPQALLTYTDGGFEEESGAAQKKRDAVLLLLRRLRRRNVPVDAVGIQSHLTTGKRYGPGLIQFRSEVREMGLEIFVTEMEVNDREAGPALARRDEAVAELYGAYLQAVLAGGASAVLTAGLIDRGTWPNRRDGRQEEGSGDASPFAADGKPRRPFFALRDAFDRAKSRDGEAGPAGL